MDFKYPNKSHIQKAGGDTDFYFLGEQDFIAKLKIQF